MLGGKTADPTLDRWDANGVRPEVSRLKTAVKHTHPRGGGWLTKTLGVVMALSSVQLASVGFDADAHFQYQKDILAVGGKIPELTVFADRWAAIFSR